MSSSVKLPTGVNWTAFITAGDRAHESSRPDALLRDPLAIALVECIRDDYEDEVDHLAAPSSNFAYVWGDYVALRGKYLDERLLAAARGGVRQVVALGAGMDGRAYRLDWPPGVRFFELDMPAGQEYKRKVIQRAQLKATASDVIPVPVDLADGEWPEALRKSGFDETQPTSWLLEGIFSYLTVPQGEKLVERFSAMSHTGSHLISCYYIADPYEAAARAGKADDSKLARTRPLFSTGPATPPVPWLSPYGWRMEDETIMTDWATKCGRYQPAGLDPEKGGVICYLSDLRRN